MELNREQYEFSNMFWDDAEWSEQIPKYYEIDDNGDMTFHYLDNDEMRAFIKIKAKENPEIMKDIRYKKLMRIFND